jgi:DNA-binding CsgD family transcriptional regulator
MPPPARTPAPYGLTARELSVLRLLAAGRSNAEIGAELYIRPSTASVHVSSILRKLGVASRVHAAALRPGSTTCTGKPSAMRRPTPPAGPAAPRRAQERPPGHGLPGLLAVIAPWIVAS